MEEATQEQFLQEAKAVEVLLVQMVQTLQTEQPIVVAVVVVVHIVQQHFLLETVVLE